MNNTYTDNYICALLKLPASLVCSLPRQRNFVSTNKRQLKENFNYIKTKQEGKRWNYVND